MLETAHTSQHPGALVEACTAISTAAGKWMAHAEVCLTQHPEQLLSVEVVDGCPCVGMESTPNLPKLSAHQRIPWFGNLLDPAVVLTFFNPPAGKASFCVVRFETDTDTIQPRLMGQFTVAQGRRGFRSAHEAEGGWPAMAQSLALVGFALSGTSPIHQAFLYSLLGDQDYRGVIELAELDKTLDRGAFTIAAEKPYDSQKISMARLVMPTHEGFTSHTVLRRTLMELGRTVVETSASAYHATRAKAAQV